MVIAAVILSGCGHKDGAEIREAVLSMLYLDQQDVKIACFAPDIEQADTVNHLTGKTMDEKRNVLVEAARIARGDIKPLSTLKASEYDLLVLPGGFGAAKNLSDFASKGKDCTVLPELAALIRDFHTQRKPVAAICIAPAVLAAALSGKTNARVTIGDDADTAKALASMGATHQDCVTENCVTDEENLLVTCSAYMRNDRIGAVAQGIEKTIREAIRMAKTSQQKAA